VGWNELMILNMNLRQAELYAEPSIEGTTSTSVQFLQPFDVVHQDRNYYYNQQRPPKESILDPQSANLFDPSNFEIIREYDDISFENRPDLYDSFSVLIIIIIIHIL
jgi:hypothetical protein